MSCDRTNDVHAYFDDLLSPARREELESHLALCADCRRMLAELVQLRAMLQEAELPGLADTTLERYRSAFYAARDRDVRRVASWMTAAAAVLLIATMAMWPDGNSGTPMTASVPWESVAVMPPTETREEASPAQVEMAQWMAEGLDGLARQNVP